MTGKELMKLLNDKMNLNELNELIFNMGLDHESIGEATTKAGKAREFVLHCERHDLLPALLSAITEQRRDIMFSSTDFADAQATIKKRDEGEGTEWIHAATIMQQTRDEERASVLALLEAEKLPVGLKAVLRYLVEHAN